MPRATEAATRKERRNWLIDWRVIAGAGSVFVFFCVIIGTAFWVIIGQNLFLRDEVHAQTSAQICRSEARTPVDDALAGAIVALSGEISLITELILEGFDLGSNRLAELDRANRLLKVATEALTETTRAQAELVEACNKASAEGQEVETTVATTTTEGD